MTHYNSPDDNTMMKTITACLALTSEYELHDQPQKKVPNTELDQDKRSMSLSPTLVCAQQTSGMVCLPTQRELF